MLKRRPWAFDTFGETNRWVRMRRGIIDMSAGNMVYGLYRISALERAGVYRHVLVPDRLLFTELSLYGQFKQVPQVLWFRRWYGRIFSLGRQRISFFPERPAAVRVLAVVDQPRGQSVLDLHRARARDVRRFPALAGIVAGRPVLRARRSAAHLADAAGDPLSASSRQIVGLRPYERRVPPDVPLHRASRSRRLDAGAPEGIHGSKGLPKSARAAWQEGAVTTASRPCAGPGSGCSMRCARCRVVKTRVIPSLLKDQLDELPAAPHVEAMRRELEPLTKTDAPIVIGPWVGEVGYELLYWIPFLNWALKEFGLEKRRLIVVSRGGARHWYRHITSEYVDVFDLFSLDEYREANELRWDKAGHQKQYRVEQMDHDIVERVRTKLGLDHVEMLHPGPMYRMLRFFWFEKAGVGILKQHTDYKPLERIDRSRGAEGSAARLRRGSLLLPAVVPGHAGQPSVRGGYRPRDQPRRSGGAPEHRAEVRRPRRSQRARHGHSPR